MNYKLKGNQRTDKKLVLIMIITNLSKKKFVTNTREASLFNQAIEEVFKNVYCIE